MRDLQSVILLGRIALAAGVLFTAAAVQDCPAGENQKEETMEEPEKPLDTRALVEALANRNPVPKFAGTRQFPWFDEKYDWGEYNRVWRAIRELTRHAEYAWPEMVRHLDDDRYCTTFQEEGTTYNRTVGDTCREIIALNLSVAYCKNLTPMTQLVYVRMAWPQIAFDKKKLKSWCEERSNKRLYELQIEMCVWAIKELGKTGDVLRVSRLKLKAWIAAIEAEIESLRESERAELFRGISEEVRTRHSPHTAESFREEYIRAKKEEDTEKKRTNCSGEEKGEREKREKRGRESCQLARPQERPRKEPAP
jgi:hypothetical protein